MSPIPKTGRGEGLIVYFRVDFFIFFYFIFFSFSRSEPANCVKMLKLDFISDFLYKNAT